MSEKEPQINSPKEISSLQVELRKIALGMLGIALFFAIPFSVIILIAVGILPEALGIGLWIVLGLPAMFLSVYLTTSQLE